jgi:hypothetical protein
MAGGVFSMSPSMAFSFLFFPASGVRAGRHTCSPQMSGQVVLSQQWVGLGFPFAAFHTKTGWGAVSVWYLEMVWAVGNQIKG